MENSKLEKQIEEIRAISKEIQKTGLGEHLCDAISVGVYDAGYRKSSDLAEEIFAEIEAYMTPLEDWFLEMKRQNQDCSEEYWGGKLAAFKQIRGFIDAELKKKYTESENNDGD